MALAALNCIRPYSARAAACAAALAATFAGVPHVPAAEGVMYRCPGNDYNNTISAKEAQTRGCRTLEGAPVTIIQTVKPRPVPAAPAASGTPVARTVDPMEQRARDNDARRILEGELRREEERLAIMRTEFNNGEPEKQGSEARNYQKYLDRVSDMRSAIARKESDIAAIKRELGKLPQ